MFSIPLSESVSRCMNTRGSIRQSLSFRPAFHVSDQFGHVARLAVLHCRDVPDLPHGVTDPHWHTERLTFVDGKANVLADAADRKAEIERARQHLLWKLVERRAVLAAAGVDHRHHDFGVDTAL